MRISTAMKRIIDFLMVSALLFLMSYSLVSDVAHEWVGMGMFLLFVAHLALNRKWIHSINKGRYPAYGVVHILHSLWEPFIEAKRNEI